MAGAGQNPPRRTAEASERCYQILSHYVEHAKSNTSVRFVTGRELPLLYESALARSLPRAKIAQHMAQRQTFQHRG